MKKDPTYIQVAKRLNNAKRNYLLVNLNQCKHCPSKPQTFFNMVDKLVNKIKKENIKGKTLIIGFAETATAISSHIASFFPEAFYIQTTREDFENLEWLSFSEVHSHATEQRLFISKLEEFMPDVENIIVIDDEITTGNTAKNLINVLKEKFNLSNPNVFLISILNRMTHECIEAMSCEKIKNIFLCKDLKDKDFVFDGTYNEPTLCESSETKKPDFLIHSNIDARLGSKVSDFNNNNQELIEEMIGKLSKLRGKTLIIGSEEFMYLAILLGEKLSSLTNKVTSQSPSRSPICVSDSHNYPIKNGYQIASAYDKDRITYIYNLRKYDNVVIVTDGHKNIEKFLGQLNALFKQQECKNIYSFEVTYDK